QHSAALVQGVGSVERAVEQAEVERTEAATEVVVAPVGQGQRAPGPEHAPDLAQRRFGVVEMMEAARADDAVEGTILERQSVRVSLDKREGMDAPLDVPPVQHLPADVEAH